LSSPWRRSRALIVDAYESADKQAKQIRNIMTKMGKKWDKILRNQGK
jgi:hypothetical protein